MKRLWFKLAFICSSNGLGVEAFRSPPSQMLQFSRCVKGRNEGKRIQHSQEFLKLQNSSDGMELSQSVRQEGNSDSVISYYLLWSPTIMRKMIISLGILLGGRFAFENWLSPYFLSFAVDTSNNTFVTVFKRLLQAIILPLLSSACCALQLLINVMVGAGGCAGFNKHLGPLRPYFLAVLLHTVIPKVLSPTGQELDFAIIRLRTIQLSLAFLPEIVHLWNVKLGIQKVPKFATSHILPVYQVKLAIPGMGCVACINKINKTLRQNPTVSDTKAWLNEEKGGSALVQYSVNSNVDAKRIAESLSEAVKAAGFDNCKIENLKQMET
mmetsp:Transcript_17093/g.25893  ORF Transcript_17093/g.25893 Transcript_17093/m.25893 type:complete len:325 (+) Transcript_17093:126-1100(+)